MRRSGRKPTSSPPRTSWTTRPGASWGRLDARRPSIALRSRRPGRRPTPQGRVRSSKALRQAHRRRRKSKGSFDAREAVTVDERPPLRGDEHLDGSSVRLDVWARLITFGARGPNRESALVFPCGRCAAPVEYRPPVVEETQLYVSWLREWISLESLERRSEVGTSRGVPTSAEPAVPEGMHQVCLEASRGV